MIKKSCCSALLSRHSEKQSKTLEGGFLLATLVFFALYVVQKSLLLSFSMTNTHLDFIFCFSFQVYAAWETDEIIGFELWRNLGLALVCVFVITLILLANIQICLMVLLCVTLTLVSFICQCEASMIFRSVKLMILFTDTTLLCLENEWNSCDAAPLISLIFFFP